MLYLNGHEIMFGSFPNHESYADLDSKFVFDERNVIHLRYESDADLLHLVFLRNTLSDMVPMASVILVCPYFPYSRMDRAQEERLFTLKSVAGLINGLNFEQVWVLEPHSDVLLALVDRVKVLSLLASLDRVTALPLLAAQDWLHDVSDSYFTPNFDGAETKGYSKMQKEGIYFVYPDAGAQKRYSSIYKYPNVITCSKERDFGTGSIEHIDVHVSDDAVLNCGCAIIVDDLCAKGGTFLGVAKELWCQLPNLEKVILCVSHCENTVFDGAVFTSDLIDSVYTTDSILGHTEEFEAKIDALQCDCKLNRYCLSVSAAGLSKGGVRLSKGGV